MTTWAAPPLHELGCPRRSTGEGSGVTSLRSVRQCSESSACGPRGPVESCSWQLSLLGCGMCWKWLGGPSAGSGASTPVLVNDALCLEQEGSLGCCLCCTGCRGPSFRGFSAAGILPLGSASLCGVGLSCACMQSVCVTVTPVSSLWLPVALPTLNPSCDNQQCLNIARYPSAFSIL